MKQLTKSNYKSDKLYPSVVRAGTAILERKLFISAIEILNELDRLDRKLYDDWRFGRIPYLERVTNGGLGMLNRILKIIQLHCHERGLKPSHTVYNRWGKGPKTLLRFSISGEANLEIAYSTHWIAEGEPKIATTAAELPLTESPPICTFVARRSASSLRQNHDGGASCNEKKKLRCTTLRVVSPNPAIHNKFRPSQTDLSPKKKNNACSCLCLAIIDMLKTPASFIARSSDVFALGTYFSSLIRYDAERRTTNDARTTV